MSVAEFATGEASPRIFNLNSCGSRWIKPEEKLKIFHRNRLFLPSPPIRSLIWEIDREVLFIHRRSASKHEKSFSENSAWRLGKEARRIKVFPEFKLNFDENGGGVSCSCLLSLSTCKSSEYIVVVVSGTFDFSKGKSFMQTEWRSESLRGLFKQLCKVHTKRKGKKLPVWLAQCIWRRARHDKGMMLRDFGWQKPRLMWFRMLACFTRFNAHFARAFAKYLNHFKSEHRGFRRSSSMNALLIVQLSANSADFAVA